MEGSGWNRAIFLVKYCRTTADSEQMKEAICRFSRIGVQNPVPDPRVGHVGLDVAAASAGFGGERGGAPDLLLVCKAAGDMM